MHNSHIFMLPTTSPLVSTISYIRIMNKIKDVDNYLKQITDNGENNGLLCDLSDDEKIDVVSKKILNKYLEAFKELAK